MVIVVFFTALIGGIIQASIGIGYGMIAIAVLSFLLPIKTIHIIVLLSAYLLNGVVAYRYRKKISMKIIILPLLPLFIGSYLGLKILLFAPENMLKLFIAIFLILLSLYMITKKQIHINNLICFGIGSGFFGGILMGIASIPGPVLSMYVLKSTRSREAYLGNLQTIFFIMSHYRLFLFYQSGGITYNDIKLSIIAVVGVILGIYVSQSIRIQFFLKKSGYEQGIYVFILLMGCSLLLN